MLVLSWVRPPLIKMFIELSVYLYFRLIFRLFVFEAEPSVYSTSLLGALGAFTYYFIKGR